MNWIISPMFETGIPVREVPDPNACTVVNRVSNVGLRRYFSPSVPYRYCPTRHVVFPEPMHPKMTFKVPGLKSNI
jgi:hypothetical protein